MFLRTFKIYIFVKRVGGGACACLFTVRMSCAICCVSVTQYCALICVYLSTQYKLKLAIRCPGLKAVNYDKTYT